MASMRNRDADTRVPTCATFYIWIIPDRIWQMVKSKGKVSSRVRDEKMTEMLMSILVSIAGGNSNDPSLSKSDQIEYRLNWIAFPENCEGVR
jgi:hypothetical protein